MQNDQCARPLPFNFASRDVRLDLWMPLHLSVPRHVLGETKMENQGNED